MRAWLGRSLEDACAEPLSAHLHQAEAANPPHLDSRPVVLQRFLHRLFDFADMALLLHVDEVDDDQPGHVAKTELTSDFCSRFNIGAESGLLDVVLAR